MFPDLSIVVVIPRYPGWPGGLALELYLSQTWVLWSWRVSEVNSADTGHRLTWECNEIRKLLHVFGLHILPGHTQAYLMPSRTRVCCETTGVTQGLQLGNRDPSLEAVI